MVHSPCDTDSPIYLTVSGQGGTGKSKVIDLLNRIVSAKFTNAIPVVVSAPTGLSAFNISGTTIHRILSLPVEHGKPADYSRLNQDTLNTLRKTLQGLKLLIIDEVSMVSSITLLFIHLRLTEIMANSQFFGGISVILFGDFLQLPPVRGNQPFVPVTQLEAKQRIGSVAALDLWSIFRYDELTINMSQKGDDRYCALLSNIRVGKLTDEDEQLLHQRLISNNVRATITDICHKYSELSANGESPIILVPRSSQCTEINTAILKKLNNDIIDLPAIDTLDTIVDQPSLPKVHQAYLKVQDDVTRTAGLDTCLQLCLGAKIMLKRNKNIEAGLVNGSVGYVTGFIMDYEKNVSAVQVKFDQVDCAVKIQRESCSFEVLKGIFLHPKTVSANGCLCNHHSQIAGT